MAERLERVHAWVETGETRCPKEGESYLQRHVHGVNVASCDYVMPGEYAILQPVPGPLWRLGKGDSVISECTANEAAHVVTTTGDIRPYRRAMVMDHEEIPATYVRIEPVAVPRDERAEQLEIAIEAGIMSRAYIVLPPFPASHRSRKVATMAEHLPPGPELDARCAVAEHEKAKGITDARP